ncbi:unnamed protein product [Caenorhabditis sp. 36 PRJEB53466]|nr:unnamed protein product [Caenorhabditis sp. 36 PRJEB53466]
MLTTLILCLCLTTTSHADDIDTRLDSTTSNSKLTSRKSSSSLSSANASSSSLINVKEELLKIATTCLTQQDLELLTGNAVRYHLVLKSYEPHSNCLHFHPGNHLTEPNQVTMSWHQQLQSKSITI